MNQGLFSFPGEAGAPTLGLTPSQVLPTNGMARGMILGADQSRRRRRVPRLLAPPQYVPRGSSGSIIAQSFPFQVPAGLPADADLIFLLGWEENAATTLTISFDSAQGSSTTPAAIVSPNAPGVIATPVVGAFGLRRGNFVPGLNTLNLGGFGSLFTSVGFMFAIAGLDPNTWLEASAQVTASANADDATASVALGGESLVLGLELGQGADLAPVRLFSSLDYQLVWTGNVEGGVSTTTAPSGAAWFGYNREGAQTLGQTVSHLGAGSISGGSTGDGRSILILALKGEP